ncbi:unnamed protein product, partial [Heterosigma akashiwo]
AHSSSTTNKVLVSQLHPLHLLLLHKHQHMMYTTAAASPPSPFHAARPVFIIMFRNHCPASCRTRLPPQENSPRIRLRETRPPAFRASVSRSQEARLVSSSGGLAPQPSRHSLLAPGLLAPQGGFHIKHASPPPY